MGWLVMVAGLTILIIIGDFQNQQMPNNKQAVLYGQARC